MDDLLSRASDLALPRLPHGGKRLGAGVTRLAAEEAVVGGADARPAVAPLFDADGLSAQELRDALRVLARLDPDRGDLD